LVLLIGPSPDSSGLGVQFPSRGSDGIFFSSPPPTGLPSSGYLGDPFPEGKATGAWSWPLTSNLCRGWKCV